MPVSGHSKETLIAPGEMALLGHRNFIVIADMAYPLQSNPSITTRYVGGDQIERVRQILEQIKAAPHVNPVVMVDGELAAITETQAPGITAFREALDALLADYTVQRRPHIDIIKQLDETAELFNVVILKTDLTLPYTSVFIELDCGYWDGEREAALRESLEQE